MRNDGNTKGLSDLSVTTSGFSYWLARFVVSNQTPNTETGRNHGNLLNAPQSQSQ